VAKALHANSRRYDKAFISINCGALPETLLESELFGYIKGAFTGASSDKRGLFQAADGGTVFLDEIGLTSSALPNAASPGAAGARVPPGGGHAGCQSGRPV